MHLHGSYSNGTYRPLFKEEHPDAGIVFIGPCAAKKLEASRRTVRSDVDFVITFEELTGMFEAKGIVPSEVEATVEMKDATGAGRGYGVAGGVASAIESVIREYYPDTEVNIEHAESLTECKKMLLLAKAGKKTALVTINISTITSSQISSITSRFSIFNRTSCIAFEYAGLSD